jgi:hypothetical protein
VWAIDSRFEQTVDGLYLRYYPQAGPAGLGYRTDSWPNLN